VQSLGQDNPRFEFGSLLLRIKNTVASGIFHTLKNHKYSKSLDYDFQKLKYIGKNPILNIQRRSM
jgi:hypothetical protein